MSEPTDPGAWRHRIEHVNGVRIHCVEAGEGPLVLLVHGFPESWYSYRHQLDVEAGRVIRRLLDWAERQFRELGRPDPDRLAVTLVAGYQGMSLLANALRDPEIMTGEGTRLIRWLDTLPAPPSAPRQE